MRFFNKVKSWVAGFSALALASAASAQEGVTVPAEITSGIADAVDMVEAIGYAMLAVVVSILFFKWIRRVMK